MCGMPGRVHPSVTGVSTPARFHRLTSTRKSAGVPGWLGRFGDLSSDIRSRAQLRSGSRNRRPEGFSIVPGRRDLWFAYLQCRRRLVEGLPSGAGETSADAAPPDA